MEMEISLGILWAVLVVYIILSAGCHLHYSERLKSFEKNIPVEYMKYIDKEIGYYNDRLDRMRDYMLSRIKDHEDTAISLKYMQNELKELMDINADRITLLEKRSTFGLELKRWRHIKKLTIKDFAAMTGISKSQLSNIERGMNPSKDEKRLIEMAMNPPSDVFNGGALAMETEERELEV